ncbi:MAG: helix-turn-helix transcriptional regulator [Bacteroidales bacterium]
MPRNAEVTRQWKLLRTIEASRVGKTIDELSEIGGVCTRTIRRDLVALQEAGFSLYDDHEGLDGKVRWRLDGHPFRALQETSFTVAELAALYFSRALLEGSVEQAFRDDLKSAFDRLDAALSPRTREFLARLPSVLLAKPRQAAKDGEDGDLAKQLVEAALDRRKIAIRYHSFSSRRIKEYELEPYRLVYGNGALYLIAYVPAYGQMRTFATKRIKKLTVLEEVFSPAHPVPADPFSNSLGISEGTPERVEIEFAERVAPYIKEREWHRSQKITPQADGSVLLSLDVCVDWALTSWILGFGPFARVVHPQTLAERILDEIEEARELYAPRLAFSADYADGRSTADYADSRRFAWDGTADYADSRRLAPDGTADYADSRRLAPDGTAGHADSRRLPLEGTADQMDSRKAEPVLRFKRRGAKREPA